MSNTKKDINCLNLSFKSIGKFFWYLFVLFSVPFIFYLLVFYIFKFGRRSFFSITNIKIYLALLILFLSFGLSFFIINLVRKYYDEVGFFTALGFNSVLFLFLGVFIGNIWFFWGMFLASILVFWILVYCNYNKSHSDNNQEDTDGIKLLSDKPCDDEKENVLWDDYEIESFAKIIRTNVLQKDNFVFGIEGQRGNGKSSFWYLTEKKLNNNIEIINFQPWFLDEQANLLRKFLEIFSEKISNNYNIPKIQRHINDLWSLVDDLDVNISIGPIKLAGKIKSKPNFKEISGNISDCLEQINANILVVVDDLDRLPMDKVLEMLKVVQICKKIKGFNFVLIYDPENFNKIDVNLKDRNYEYRNKDKTKIQMKESLNNQNIKHYIEKIVNITYPCYYGDDKLIEFADKQLAKYTKKEYKNNIDIVKELLTKDQKEEILDGLEEVIKEFRPYRHGKSYSINPRFIKRVVNSLILTLNEIKDFGVFDEFKEINKNINSNTPNIISIENFFDEFNLAVFIKIKILFLYEKEKFDILKKETEKHNSAFFPWMNKKSINPFLINFKNNASNGQNSITIKKDINKVVDDIIERQNYLDIFDKELDYKNNKSTHSIDSINNNIKQYIYLISNKYRETISILLDRTIKSYSIDIYEQIDNKKDIGNLIDNFIEPTKEYLIYNDRYKYIKSLNIKIEETDSYDKKATIIKTYLYKKLIEGLIKNIKKDYRKRKSSKKSKTYNIDNIKDIIVFIIKESKDKKVDGGWIGYKIYNIIGIKEIKNDIDLENDIFEKIKKHFDLLEGLYIVHWLKTMLVDRKNNSWNGEDIEKFYKAFYSIYNLETKKILKKIDSINKLPNNNFWKDLSKLGLFKRLVKLLFAYKSTRNDFINEFFGKDNKIQKNYIEYLLELLLMGVFINSNSNELEFIKEERFRWKDLLIEKLEENKKENKKRIETWLENNEDIYYFRGKEGEKSISLKEGWEYLKDKGKLFFTNSNS